MTKPAKPLTIRLGEFRPVVDATELTKGIRGKIVGGKKRFAQLLPVEGGMLVEMFGSSTFVPIATGALGKTLRVDADLLAGFLRNSTAAFHPAEILSLDISDDRFVARCGTLKVTLQLGGAPSGHLQGGKRPELPSTPDLSPSKHESETAPAKAVERMPERPEGQATDNASNRNSHLKADPAEAVLRMLAAEAKPEARAANRIRDDQPEVKVVDVANEKAPSRWRRNLIIGVSTLMFFAAIQHPIAQRAYYQDGAVFLGMVIFLPILTAIFSGFGIAFFDFRGGSVSLNRFRAFSKWFSASVMPLPLRVSAG